jgi:EAL domain-containing protein (putative c-di-GMP-specific phosphodiesterase class I)
LFAQDDLKQGESTMYESTEQSVVVAAPLFGLRKIAPRACIADKPHLQEFFCEALEDLGFVTHKFERHASIAGILGEYQPDVFVLGLSVGGIDAAQALEALSAGQYHGRVLIVGAPASLMAKAVQNLGAELGLNMLPLLATPFSHDALRAVLSDLLPREAPPKPIVDVAEALHSNWLELWYQPKIDIRSLTLCGAEALIRLRHPTWGVVQPAAFLPDEHDPHFLALSDFVLSQAVRDWHSFLNDYGHVELAINLPVSFFSHAHAIERLMQRMPKHPAFQGAIVEINGADIIDNMAAAISAAGTLRFHNIAVSVDDLGADWPGLLQCDPFPFTEIKVDRDLVSGCADDRLKQVVCRRILEFADSVGARTVAEGVENRADFVTVRELGFDMVQGFFLAKPMDARKFARRILRQPLEIP